MAEAARAVGKSTEGPANGINVHGISVDLIAVGARMATAELEEHTQGRRMGVPTAPPLDGSGGGDKLVRDCDTPKML